MIEQGILVINSDILFNHSELAVKGVNCRTVSQVLDQMARLDICRYSAACRWK